MNPTPNYNHHERTEDGCEICGFMKPNCLDYKDLYRKYRPRELRDIVEGGGSSTSHHVSPGCLRGTPVRLFPKARNPYLPYICNDPGRASRSPSDSLTLLDLKHLLCNYHHKDADKSDPYRTMSQQQPPELAPISLQLPAASIVARKNCAPWQGMQLLPVKKTSPSVQPYTNPVLPEESLSSYTDKPYQSQAIPIPSSHKELLYTELGTTEMYSSTNTSEMPTHSAPSFISSTTNTSSTDNVMTGWKLMNPLSNKTHKEKQSSKHPNVSGTSSRNGKACDDRSKETPITSGTSSSEEFKEFSLTSLKTKGGEKWCVFCAKNQETKQFVRSHTLYNSETGYVQCPILRSHHCEVCSATGNFAHTLSYCPFICMQEGKVQSTALSVSSTQRQSNGMARKYKVQNSPLN